MKYYVDYFDKSGGLSHVWVDAQSESEAISAARSEYCDINKILNIRRA